MDRPLNKRLVDLRFRLDAARQDCRRRQDEDGVSWLSDGIQALSQAVDIIDQWAEWWSDRPCPEDEGQYLDQLIKRTIGAKP